MTKFKIASFASENYAHYCCLDDVTHFFSDSSLSLTCVF